jgi:hypothetical protein
MVATSSGVLGDLNARHGRAGDNVKRYDPNRAPEPGEWLELDEQERIVLVERFHRKMAEPAQSLEAHAIIHTTVETQLALNDPPTAREALTRLMGEGLDRHEAIHWTCITSLNWPWESFGAYGSFPSGCWYTSRVSYRASWAFG